MKTKEVIAAAEVALQIQEKSPNRKSVWKRFFSCVIPEKSKSKEIVMNEKDSKMKKFKSRSSTKAKIHEEKSKVNDELVCEKNRMAENLPEFAEKRKRLSLQWLLRSKNSSKTGEKSKKRNVSAKTVVEVYSDLKQLSESVDDNAFSTKICKDEKNECKTHEELKSNGENAKQNELRTPSKSSLKPSRIPIRIKSKSNEIAESTLEDFQASQVIDSKKRGNLGNLIKNPFGPRYPSAANLSSSLTYVIEIDGDYVNSLPIVKDEDYANDSIINNNKISAKHHDKDIFDSVDMDIVEEVVGTHNPKKECTITNEIKNKSFCLETDEQKEAAYILDEPTINVAARYVDQIIECIVQRIDTTKTTENDLTECKIDQDVHKVDLTQKADDILVNYSSNIQNNKNKIELGGDCANVDHIICVKLSDVDDSKLSEISVLKNSTDCLKIHLSDSPPTCDISESEFEDFEPIHDDSKRRGCVRRFIPLGRRSQSRLSLSRRENYVKDCDKSTLTIKDEDQVSLKGTKQIEVKKADDDAIKLHSVPLDIKNGVDRDDLEKEITIIDEIENIPVSLEIDEPKESEIISKCPSTYVAQSQIQEIISKIVEQIRIDTDDKDKKISKPNIVFRKRVKLPKFCMPTIEELPEDEENAD